MSTDYHICAYVQVHLCMGIESTLTDVYSFTTSFWKCMHARVSINTHRYEDISFLHRLSNLNMITCTYIVFLTLFAKISKFVSNLLYFQILTVFML